MTMRIHITNNEPGFSDARVAIQGVGDRRIVLTGGESIEIVAEPGARNQITLQTLARDGDEE